MSLVFLLFLAYWVALASAWSAKPYDLKDVKLHFERFIQKHNKQYFSENEKQVRFEIFRENLESVNYMNEKSDHAVFGITKFMDLTQEEFVKTYTGMRRSFNGNDFPVFIDDCDLMTDSNVTDIDAPASFDWREHGVVTHVKNQTMQCGSCYAFTAVDLYELYEAEKGNIEGQYALKYKKLQEFSEQQIVDCGHMLGCGGGSASQSFRELIKMGGAMSEADYPYKAVHGFCNFDKSKVTVKLSNCYTYNITSQEKVKQLLYQTGPLAIGVASHEFRKYVKGIMSDDFCGNYDVNHAVLLIGYGTENGKDYWIVKNSWGEDFGEDGYFRMQRGEGAASCKMMNDKMATSIIL